MRLILVRHGETVADSGRRYWGRTDVELSALGLKQAGRLRERLQSEPIQAVYSSNLSRARLTAETIASGNGLAITACAELDEVDFGVLEGLTAEEIRARHPEFYERWLGWDASLAFPGGESVKDFNARVCRFIDRLKSHDARDTFC